MAATYKGNSGRTYTTIEPPIGKGGEGAVYRIAGATGYVLKVFAPARRTETRKRKLLAMIRTPLSAEAMKQVTWPTDVVYSNGQFVGYVMPMLKNSEDLNVIYSDKYKSTLRERIIIAKNLCAAINSVHNAGQVCGDLNPKNISVDPHGAKVTLVDTDSYHITDPKSNKVFRCEVGLPEYLPREVQEKMKNGYRLDNAPLPTFTKYTDLFALAVHIFALLMNGCHPFACATSTGTNIGSLAASQPSVYAPQPIENICTGFFPFFMRKNRITTPKYAPDFSMLPQYIRDLFVRAFVSGHAQPSMRPDAVEWYNALSKLEKDLKCCGRDKDHVYPSHLSKCPWCELNAQMQKSMPVNYKPPTPKQRVQNIAAGAVNTVTRTPQRTPGGTPAATGTTGNYVSKTAKGFASETVFWIVTMILPAAAIFLIDYLTYGAITWSVFGYEYGSSIESWGSNLAIWMGPWGYVLCGLVGTYVYNTYWSVKGKLYGYQWHHYALSFLTSMIAAALWIAVVFLITIASMIVVGLLIFAVICGMFSG